METLTTVTSQIMTQASSLVTTIGSNPLMLVGIGFGFVAGAIGIARKLMHK